MKLKLTLEKLKESWGKGRVRQREEKPQIYSEVLKQHKKIFSEDQILSQGFP